MKRKKKPPGQQARRSQNPEPANPADSSPAVPSRRRRVFVLVAVTLPFLFLGMLELALRLAGYGYDPAFFKTEPDAAGRAFLVNNDDFTRRFFPPELARWAGAFKFAAVKPPEVQRIFVFGESAAMGDPQPSVGASRYLEILLREKFPGRKFEVINLGITAINSHVIVPIAQAVAAQGQGDLWLIYMGNNEMVGPFGAATVFGAQAAPLGVVRLNLAVQKTRVGQLAVSLLRHFRGKSRHETWGGMTMFLQNQIPPGDPRRETVYQNFTRNLEAIVDAGKTGGAGIVLSTVAVNLRDCPPFGSLPAQPLAVADQKKFEALYSQALSLQTNQQPVAAAQIFLEAAKLNPAFAELQFRRAQCLLDTTNPAAAREFFQLACDVDALPFRADTRINGVIRDVAAASGTGMALCDTELALAATAPVGVSGDESFFEHVHFNFDGNYRLALAWAEKLVPLLPEPIRSRATAGWAAQDVCERALGLSDWNRAQVISSVLSRMRVPPLAAQFNNPARAQGLMRELGILRQRQLQSNAVTQARMDFATAMAQAPGDKFLRENYAVFLKSIGDKPGALAEYLSVTKEYPHDFPATLSAGRLLGELGRLAEAETMLRRAAEQRPTQPDAWFELGVVLLAGGQYDAALAMLDRVARQHPTDTACLTYQARALSKLERHAEAIQKQREVIRLNPDSWAAQLELAVELTATGQLPEATQAYQAAVRLNPRHPTMHVNLGVLLARQNRLDEAVEQFQIALNQDPANAAARDYLHQVEERRRQVFSAPIKN